MGDAITVERISRAPSDDVIDLFRSSFPRHPVARASRRLTADFLAAFAANATFLVAHAGGRDIGFLVGGDTAQLNRAREGFIRAHAVRIAAASIRYGSLLRAVFARLRRPKAAPPTADVPFQLRLMAVASNKQRAGVGAALLHAFEATLPSGSAYHLWILAENSGAEQFYRANGAVEDARIDGHVRLRKPLP